MPLPLTSIVAASLALAQSSVESITCTPNSYTQVQDGEEYERVDCAKSRATKPECSVRSYTISALHISPLAYTSSRQLAPQGEFLGRSHLLIDRGTGAFHFVVIATTASDPVWHNVKTFSGGCTSANDKLPL